MNNTYVYLETSAVNYLLDNFSFDKLSVLKSAAYDAEKICFCISTPTIFEILSTKDEIRREQLIHTIQTICYERLINSPAEFIINYIHAGMPKVEKKYEFFSNLNIADVWSDICKDTRKTFIFDSSDLESRKSFLCKKFKEIVSDIFENKTHWGQTINSIIKLDINYHKMNEFELEIKRISWILILLILCAGTTFESTCIDKFWRYYDIEETIDRANYALFNFNRLTECGPIVMMARMWISQLKKANRGTLLDMFHSIYIVYCDMFLTNDYHFEVFKKSDSYEYFKKIDLISTNDFFSEFKNL